MPYILLIGLMTLLPFQAGAQSLTPADVSVIIEMTVEDMRTTVHPATFGHPRGNRPFIVEEKALEAFRNVAPGLERLPEVGRHHAVKARSEVLNCARGGARCQVADDGILLNFVNVLPDEDKPGRFRVRIDPIFNLESGIRDDRTIVLVFERVAGEWKIVDGMLVGF